MSKVLVDAFNLVSTSESVETWYKQKFNSLIDDERLDDLSISVIYDIVFDDIAKKMNGKHVTKNGRSHIEIEESEYTMFLLGTTDVKD